MNEVEHVLGCQNELGEGPIWHVGDSGGQGRLYWTDIMGCCFYRYDPASGVVERFDAGLPVGALAFRAGGGLVLATRDGFASWEEGAAALTFIADPEAHRPEARFNDGAVDRRGRFWAGTMAEGPTSALYRLDPDGTVQTMERNVSIANGIGWSLDDRTMYFTDSPLKVIYAYDFDVATGAIANRRPLIETPDEPGVPDGLAVDSEGFIWSARWGGWKVTRYDPEGKVEREVRLPVECPTSCAFGGEGLDELYITSAWTAVSNRAEQPLAGDLFRLRTEVRGVVEPFFGKGVGSRE